MSGNSRTGNRSQADHTEQNNRHAHHRGKDRTRNTDAWKDHDFEAVLVVTIAVVRRLINRGRPFPARS